MKGVQDYLASAAEYDAGSFAWIIVSSIICFKIIFGVGLLYSGYTNRKNGIASIWISTAVLVMSSISWLLFGMSFTYGTGNSFYGDWSYVGHKAVFDESSGGIPLLLFSFFQLTFQCATVAIFMGGAAERANLACIPVIAFIWPIVVYNPIAHWVWSEKGWLGQLGVLDFAGGSPVHITSGASAAAFSMYLSYPVFRSRKHTTRALRVLEHHRPHNMMQMVVSIILVWSGWLAFDGASTLALNMRSVVAMVVTHTAASFGAAIWCLFEFIETKKWTFTAVVSGSIGGLVAITPASGFVDVPSSMLVGAVGSGVSYFACKFKYTRLAHRIGFVDPCDVVGSHLISGIAGGLLTGIFAQKTIAATDGATEIAGGWLDGNFKQLAYQIVDCVAVAAWAFCITWTLVALVDCVPGLEVLATEEVVAKGLDAAQVNEFLGDEQWQQDPHALAFSDDIPLSAPRPVSDSESSSLKEAAAVRITPV